MKKLFILANWKSNKTIDTAEEWIHSFHKQFEPKLSLDSKEIIISPSFTLFEHLHYCTDNLKLPFSFAAQNISPFTEGSYTGEVNGRQIKEFANYVIIGHSERRGNFFEDDLILTNKVKQAKKYNLIPIFCVQGKETRVPDSIDMVLYEPIFAIGTGNPDTPSNAEEVADFLKTNYKIKYVLYGGSITSKNAKDFTQMPHLDGIAVGRESLDPVEFFKICKNA